ncbi:pyridoxal-phosphate dependent enzyme [Aestuariivirga sp.]|uniref:pyridoxal-phosphate dependent enzyme n=1 Tax=Aestuariivirga sp. TaxID=2650926 RepID=UPI0039E39530
MTLTQDTDANLAADIPLPRTYHSILDTIGNTPVVRLSSLEPDGVELYAKLEFFNPLGSIKDRLALGVIEAAEREGKLQPGQTVIEATSGNTGIGLAMVCARKGYPLVVVMSESFSVERRRLMRFLGAKVVLTPAAEKGTGMIEKARELSTAHGWFWTRQFENDANAAIHRQTTALEILRTFGPHGLDYFVTGSGTGGTLQGVASVLRIESGNTKIVVAEPENVPILASGIRQAYNGDGTPGASHPHFRPHPIQGWTPDFIPRLTSEAFGKGLVDLIQPVSGTDALHLTMELARKEGIFCGISGGATLAAALATAKSASRGSRILFMVPDTGERYLSTPLFENIEQEMTAEEREISNSTPRGRFVISAPPASTGPAAVHSQVSERAETFVRTTINDQQNPLVMFALEWCEFCWAVRKFLRAIGVPFVSVDLDGLKLQSDGFSQEIRNALHAITGSPTIPQIFLKGRLLGGAVDVLSLHEQGTLTPLLVKSGLSPTEISFSARDYLPKWLATRTAA